MADPRDQRKGALNLDDVFAEYFFGPSGEFLPQNVKSSGFDGGCDDDDDAEDDGDDNGIDDGPSGQKRQRSSMRNMSEQQRIERRCDPCQARTSTVSRLAR